MAAHCNKDGGDQKPAHEKTNRPEKVEVRITKNKEAQAKGVRLKERAGSPNNDGENINVYFDPANSETEARLKQKLITNGFKGTFAGADGDEICESDIDNLYVYASYNFEIKITYVFISFNEYLDLVFVDRIEGDITGDAERIRLIIEEYLSDTQ